jgi:methionine-gamma-lyase
MERDFSRFGVEYDFVDTSDLSKIEEAIRPETKLLYIETPANPTIKLTDIKACAEIAHKHGILLAVDNTFMSPILQRPIELGADIVIHSMTKFINGHSDIVGGMILPATDKLLKEISHVLFYLGGTIDPHQAWLALRGVKTLSLRVKSAQDNAMRVAEFLESHPAVEWVAYPGLESFGNKEVIEKQMDGPGSLIAFELKGGFEAGVKMLEKVELATLAVSLGGVETLIQHPASMTHAAMDPESRKAAGISDGLVRISVGCEDFDDLREDLENSLNGI